MWGGNMATRSWPSDKARPCMTVVGQQADGGDGREMMLVPLEMLAATALLVVRVVGTARGACSAHVNGGDQGSGATQGVNCARGAGTEIVELGGKE